MNGNDVYRGVKDADSGVRKAGVIVGWFGSVHCLGLGICIQSAGVKVYYYYLCIGERRWISHTLHAHGSTRIVGKDREGDVDEAFLRSLPNSSHPFLPNCMHSRFIILCVNCDIAISRSCHIAAYLFETHSQIEKRLPHPSPRLDCCLLGTCTVSRHCPSTRKLNPSLEKEGLERTGDARFLMQLFHLARPILILENARS